MEKARSTVIIPSVDHSRSVRQTDEMGPYNRGTLRPEFGDDEWYLIILYGHLYRLPGSSERFVNAWTHLQLSANSQRTTEYPSDDERCSQNNNNMAGSAACRVAGKDEADTLAKRARLIRT